MYPYTQLKGIVNNNIKNVVIFVMKQMHMNFIINIRYNVTGKFTETVRMSNINAIANPFFYPELTNKAQPIVSRNRSMLTVSQKPKITNIRAFVFVFNRDVVCTVESPPIDPLHHQQQFIECDVLVVDGDTANVIPQFHL